VETVNLSQLVRELYPLLGCLISAEVVFEHDLIEDIPNVAADVIALQQALLQVTSNASEAQQAPGSIKVATGHMETTSDYLLQCSIGKDLPPGSYAYVEVSDEGRGLDEETRGRMFDSFFSTKFAARGLGLTSVSDILRRHRGGIRIEDGPDGGTTCRILFPSTGWRTPTVRREKLSTTHLVADRIQREHASHPAELVTVWTVDEAQAEVIKTQLSPAQVQQVLLLWQRVSG
jgi:signal transduction histidine kinase